MQGGVVTDSYTEAAGNALWSTVLPGALAQKRRVTALSWGSVDLRILIANNAPGCILYYGLLWVSLPIE